MGRVAEYGRSLCKNCALLSRTEGRHLLCCIPSSQDGTVELDASCLLQESFALGCNHRISVEKTSETDVSKSSCKLPNPAAVLMLGHSRTAPMANGDLGETFQGKCFQQADGNCWMQSLLEN